MSHCAARGSNGTFPTGSANNNYAKPANIRSGSGKGCGSACHAVISQGMVVIIGSMGTTNHENGLAQDTLGKPFLWSSWLCYCGAFIPYSAIAYIHHSNPYSSKRGKCSAYRYWHVYTFVVEWGSPQEYPSATVPVCIYRASPRLSVLPFFSGEAGKTYTVCRA
jgi:hypothetical protein